MQFLTNIKMRNEIVDGQIGNDYNFNLRIEIEPLHFHSLQVGLESSLLSN